MPTKYLTHDAPGGCVTGQHTERGGTAQGGRPMKPKSNNPKDIADYLSRNFAHLVIGVTRITANSPDWRGKVNLGKAAGARGTNDRAARPVESAERLGLIERRGMEAGNCYIYNVTELGQQVLAELDADE